MKNSSIEIYKKIPIYRDVTSDDVYIYTRKRGEGRINFPSVKECKKYIDDNFEDIKCSKNVVVGGCGGKKKAVKSSSEISLDKIKKAEQILIDNGIEEDEADVVLQAIGYALLDKELYSEN